MLIVSPECDKIVNLDIVKLIEITKSNNLLFYFLGANAGELKCAEITYEHWGKAREAFEYIKKSYDIGAKVCDLGSIGE